jgi:hypothetical protein
MPRFFKKGRGGVPAGLKSKTTKKSSYPRRRTSALASAAGAMVLYKGAKMYRARQIASTKVERLRARNNRASRLATSDNITSMSPIVIGVPRKPGFDEQVARVTNKPIQFARNYQWSAEGYSGRKAHFIIEFNKNNSDDLQNDTETYAGEYFTNTSTANATIGAATIADQKRYYIDYQKETINFMNSSSNSLTGKMTLYVHKRDNDNAIGGVVPINPVTLMMYYSSQNRPLNVTSGSEGTLGNGFQFDNATSGSNFQGVYNMPGSSITSTAVCASTDPALSPSSSHVREGVDFWFKKVASDTFSLKPGQQVTKSITFNDLPQIFREQQEFIHIAGVSYVLHVEFIGQIVGDGTTTTGDGVVSTGTTQLSCVRNSTRIIGVKSKIRPKIVLRTAPRAAVALAQQIIINPDTGVELDT